MYNDPWNWNSIFVSVTYVWCHIIIMLYTWHICIPSGKLSHSVISTLWDPMDYSTSGSRVLHHLLELAQTHAHRVSDVIHHLILCHLLLLLPSIFPSIRVFSNESTLCIRWPKYWSFSFSISPFNEYSGLISFNIDQLLSIGLLFQTRWPCSPCAHCFVCSGWKKRPLKETLYIWQEEGELV